MSIFNNYDKPGKGVEKNKPKKLPIVIFFETAEESIGNLFSRAFCLRFLVSRG